jgi:hypothetical protein
MIQRHHRSYVLHFQHFASIAHILHRPLGSLWRRCKLMANVVMARDPYVMVSALKRSHHQSCRNHVSLFLYIYIHIDNYMILYEYICIYIYRLL